MNPPPPPPPHGWQPYPYPYPPAPQRSTTPRTLGTLSMVFGALTAASSAAMLSLGKQLNGFSAPPGHEAAWQRYTDDVAAATNASSVVFVVMSLALFFIGMGQRNYRHWAVRATRLWSVLGFFVIAASLVAAVTIHVPALTELVDAMGDSTEAQTLRISGLAGTFVGLLSYVPYPIVLLVAFRRPHNLAAMTSGAPPVPTATVHR